jgi:hypothetical protein
MQLPMSDLMVATIKAKKGRKKRKGVATPSGAAAQPAGGGGGGRKRAIQSVIFQKPEQLNVIVATEAVPLCEEKKVIYEHTARCALLPLTTEETPASLDVWNKLKKAFSILEQEHTVLVRKAIENNKVTTPSLHPVSLLPFLSSCVHLVLPVSLLIISSHLISSVRSKRTRKSSKGSWFQCDLQSREF